MFPGVKPKPFSMSFSKISYLISEAVGPYFNTLNIEDVKKKQLIVHNLLRRNNQQTGENIASN